MSMLTLRIDDKLDQQLSELSVSTGKSKSELAREALSGHVFRTRLETLSAKFAQHARAMGIYTEDDVMRMCNEARAEDRAKAKAEKTAKLDAA